MRSPALDRDGLLHGDGLYRAVGYRVNPATGWRSTFPWTGYGLGMGAALADLERRMMEQYREHPHPHRIVYEAATIYRFREA